MVRFRSLLAWLATAMAMGVAAAAVLGQGGRWSERLDVLNHFAPIWLALALAAIGLWVASRDRSRTAPLLASLAAALTLTQIVPELAAAMAPRQPPKGGEQVKVLQFNLWGRNADKEGVERWILAQDPDVIVFEEAFTRHHPLIRDLKARYPYLVTCRGARDCSQTIIAKKPPIASSGLLGELHFSSAWATFMGAGGPYTVVGVHYSWPWPPGRQEVQAGRIARYIGQFPKERMIIAGDMNSTPWSFALRRQDRAFGLERRTRALWSWPAGPFSRYRLPGPLPVLPIDQVYAGRGWRTIEVRRGPWLGSDHYPVLVTLEAVR